MKKLYEFTIDKEEEVDDVQVEQKDGKEVRTISKVKKEVPYKFFLLKPSRTLMDEGQLFYSATLSDYIKKGLLTRAMLAKRYAEDNGIWSQEDTKEYTSLYVQYFTLQKDIETLSKDNAPENQESLKEKQKLLPDVIGKIQRFEQTQTALFNETAESKARDKSIIWWTLFLAYDEKEKSIFGDGDFKSKLVKLDEIEDNEDKFLTDVVKRFSYLIGLWYIGLASTTEEFAKLDKEYAGNSQKQA